MLARALAACLLGWLVGWMAGVGVTRPGVRSPKRIAVAKHVGESLDDVNAILNSQYHSSGDSAAAAGHSGAGPDVGAGALGDSMRVRWGQKTVRSFSTAL